MQNSCVKDMVSGYGPEQLRILGETKGMDLFCVYGFIETNEQQNLHLQKKYPRDFFRDAKQCSLPLQQYNELVEY